MLVTFESSSAAAAADRNENFLVSARFESTLTVAFAGAGDVVKAMAPGAIVALPANATTPMTTESDWVIAEKASPAFQRQLPENTILYKLNDHERPMWCYSYDSGFSKACREMKHVLAVYVLLLNPEDTAATTSQGRLRVRLATVVARQPSPSFTMVSYRRDPSHPNQASTTGIPTVRTAQDNLKQIAATERSEDPLPSPEQSTIASTLLSSGGSNSPTRHGSFQLVSDNVGLDTMVNDGWTKDNTSETQLQQRASSQLAPEPSCCPLCEQPLTLKTHSFQLKVQDHVKSLLVLRLFAHDTPIKAFAFYFKEMDQRIRRQWLSTILPVRQGFSCDEDSGSALAAFVGFDFSLANFVVDGAEKATTTALNPFFERAVLRSFADLVLDAFSSVRLQEIITSTVLGNEMAQGDSITQCGHFNKVIMDIFDEFTHLLATHLHKSVPRCGHTSITALVDDILSLIYSEPKYQARCGEVDALLLRKDDFLEAEFRELFRVFVAQAQLRNAKPLRAAHQAYTGISSLPDVWARGSSQWQAFSSNGVPVRHEVDSPRSWNRRWFLDPTSLFVVPSPSATGGYSASLVSTLVLIRMLASVDLVLEGTRLTIDAAMSETTLQLPGLSGTVLELDGQTHAFEALPSGLLSAAGAVVFGSFWGVETYKGFAADDGMSLHISLTTSTNLYASTTQREVMAHQMRVVLVLHDTHDLRGDSISVSAETFVAWVPSHHINAHLWQSSAQTDLFLEDASELEWLPMVEISAMYIAMPQHSLIGQR